MQDIAKVFSKVPSDSFTSRLLEPSLFIADVSAVGRIEYIDYDIESLKERRRELTKQLIDLDRQYAKMLDKMKKEELRLEALKKECDVVIEQIVKGKEEEVEDYEEYLVPNFDKMFD